MLESLFQWCKGYVIIELCGKEKERFINLCKNKEIEIIHIFLLKQRFYCKMKYRDFFLLKQIGLKTGCKPCIRKKCGLPFFISKIKKRKGLLIGALFFGFMITQCAGRLWKIDVQGGFLHTREQLVHVLQEEMDVHGGISTSLVDCFEIEKKLRLKYPEIGWISAERRGCRLHIMLNESVMPKLKQLPDKTMHIVAAKDGIVRKVEVLRGIPQVKPGQEVKEGDVLISGIIPVIGDYEELIRTELVCADGSVWIEAQFDYADSFSMNYEVRKVTAEKKGLEIFLFQRKLFSYIPRYSEGKYDIMSIDIVPYMFQDYAAPVMIKKYRSIRYETELLRLTVDEAKKKAYDRFQVFLKDWASQGVEILSSQVNSKTGQMNCESEGTIIACGQFTSYREILEEEWNTEYEYRGDNP